MELFSIRIQRTFQLVSTAYSWEIELSNGLEVEFDLNFNVIDYDD